MSITREHQQYGNYVAVGDHRDVEAAMIMLRDAADILEILKEDHKTLRLEKFELICHSKEQNGIIGPTVGWKVGVSFNTEENELYYLGGCTKEEE